MTSWQGDLKLGENNINTYCYDASLKNSLLIEEQIFFGEKSMLSGPDLDYGGPWGKNICLPPSIYFANFFANYY